MTTASITDRAIGALLGAAVGDALAARSESSPAARSEVPTTRGARGHQERDPGEWTDDTSMSVPIARLAARGARFDEPGPLGQLAAAWREWARGTHDDVGRQTREVLEALEAPTEEAARAAARLVHIRRGRSAGNGSLVRTSALAAAYLDDPPGLALAARRVSDLTHFEQDAGDACVIWTLAVRHAIVTGELNIRDGIDMLDPERRERWHGLLDEAEQRMPGEFPESAWVVPAVQAAWSAVSHGRGLVETLELAAEAGADAGSVATIAGGMVGARHGVSAIPAAWRRVLHGWPGMRARHLTELAALAANGGRPDAVGWPSAARLAPGEVDTLVRHPHDEGVWLASLAGLDRLPSEVDAVVALCRIGADQTGRPERELIEFWLVDGEGANPNLDFILHDAADTVAALRSEGKTVVLHCSDGRTRTPLVGAAYSIRHLSVPVDRAWAEVRAAVDGEGDGGGLAPALARVRPAVGGTR